jgi:hypothetical protein
MDVVEHALLQSVLNSPSPFAPVFLLTRQEAEILYRAIRFHCFGHEPEALLAVGLVRRLGDWLEDEE